MIVENDADVREVIADILAMEGYRTVQATNGAEALVLLETRVRPCIVILDLLMPVMDGEEFLRHVRAQPAGLKDLKVILCTADKRVVPGVQPDAILRKPFDLDELVHIVHAHCG